MVSFVAIVDDYFRRGTFVWGNWKRSFGDNKSVERTVFAGRSLNRHPYRGNMFRSQTNPDDN
jgi:hypothetical protein